MLIDLLVELLLRFLAEPSKFSVNRERRRQMRQLLKRARTLVQEGEYERPRVLLGAALALRAGARRKNCDSVEPGHKRGPVRYCRPIAAARREEVRRDQCCASRDITMLCPRLDFVFRFRSWRSDT